MATYNWKPRERNYQQENELLLKSCPDKEASDHPLKSSWVAVDPNVKSRKQTVLSPAKPVKKEEQPFDPLSGALDPLSAAASAGFVDPLSGMSASTAFVDATGGSGGSIAMAVLAKSSTTLTTSDGLVSIGGDALEFIQWPKKRAAVLQKYTTNKNIPVASKIMEDGPQAPKVVTQGDKVKSRLEQLEESDEEREGTTMMTQKECIAHIENLHSELMDAWGQEDRVKALKLVIQCCKLLGETSVPQFYPSIWVLVSEILDTFGKLVYDRISTLGGRTDATGKPTKLPDTFTPDMVSEKEKETCRNWFFKISSIRELLPRIYVELAIFKCNRFLTNKMDDIANDLRRVGRCIRGVGDPLVANYCRAYLAKKCHEILPSTRPFMIELFDDFLFTRQQWEHPRVGKRMESAGLTLPEYIDLYSPSVEYILNVLGFKAQDDMFTAVLAKYKSTCILSMVLNHIIGSFPSSFIAENSAQFLRMILDCDDTTLKRHFLMKTFGEKLVQSAPPKQHTLQILNEVFKVVTAVTDPKEYIEVASVYIEYVLKYLTEKHVNVLLGDIKDHVMPDKAYEQLEPQLRDVVIKIFSYVKNFVAIFAMENFLPILDMFSSATKVELSKTILSAFASAPSSQVSADPVVINSLFDLASKLHDAMNSLTPDDEKRQIAYLITKFISRIDFGKDFEQFLNFFVECRRTFNGLDAIKDTLVINVLSLAMRTSAMVKNKHTKKTLSFVKACLSYSHITVPSIEDALMRLRLFLFGGCVALINGLLPQADAMLRIAVTTVAEVPPFITSGDVKVSSTEDALVQIMSTFSTILISAPGHPEAGAFYLVRGLLNVLHEYSWEPGSDAKIRIYTNFLGALAAMHQKRLPYHWQKVSSNDDLFFADPSFREDVVALGNTLLDSILNDLAALGEYPDISAARKQSRCASELFSRLLADGELENNAPLFKLAYNLVGLAKKNADGGALMQLRSCVVHLRYLAQSGGSKVYSDLLAKISSAHADLCQ